MRCEPGLIRLGFEEPVFLATFNILVHQEVVDSDLSLSVRCLRGEIRNAVGEEFSAPLAVADRRGIQM